MLQRSSPRAAALAAGLLALAACPAPPELLPPPFGPDQNAPGPVRLFFPSGLAVAPSGFVLVANGNFDHAFDAGTVVSLPRTLFDKLFDSTTPGTVDLDINDKAFATSHPDLGAPFTGAVMIGNYAGPIALDRAGITAFTGSRDTSTLNAISLDPATGGLSCFRGTGQSDTNCRKGLIDTGSAYQLEGPFAITNGVARVPGQAQDQSVIFVTALIPHVDEIINNAPFTHAPLLALDANDPTRKVFLANVSDAITAGGIGAGSMVFDEHRRQLILAGCYVRFNNGAVGEPSSGKCGSTRASNLLRFVGVDEGDNANVQVVDIAGDVRATETSSLALGNEDAAGVPQTLYAAVRNPDLIAEIDLPSDPTRLVQVRRATPLPIAPAQLLRIARPPGETGSDLLAITTELTGAVDIYDSTAGQVVASVEQLGDSPFSIVQLPPRPGDTAARLVATVFGVCRLALIDVSYQRPWEARLRARLGSCPK